MWWKVKEPPYVTHPSLGWIATVGLRHLIGIYGMGQRKAGGSEQVGELAWVLLGPPGSVSGCCGMLPGSVTTAA
jgi:hypothetical protein